MQYAISTAAMTSRADTRRGCEHCHARSRNISPQMDLGKCSRQGGHQVCPHGAGCINAESGLHTPIQPRCSLSLFAVQDRLADRPARFFHSHSKRQDCPCWALKCFKAHCKRQAARLALGPAGGKSASLLDEGLGLPVPCSPDLLLLCGFLSFWASEAAALCGRARLPDVLL